MKVRFKKHLGGLRPVDKCKTYDNLSLGEEIEIDIKTPRNIRFHRKFFALINLAFENQHNYIKQEDLREDLTIAAGFYTERTNYLTQETKLVADSISFAKMNDEEFSKVYNAVLDCVWRFLGASKEDVINELIGF